MDNYHYSLIKLRDSAIRIVTGRDGRTTCQCLLEEMLATPSWGESPAESSGHEIKNGPVAVWDWEEAPGKRGVVFASDIVADTTSWVVKLVVPVEEPVASEPPSPPVEQDGSEGQT
jgi:hypothetical protein